MLSGCTAVAISVTEMWKISWPKGASQSARLHRMGSQHCIHGGVFVGMRLECLEHVLPDLEGDGHFGGCFLFAAGAAK